MTPKNLCGPAFPCSDQSSLLRIGQAAIADLPDTADVHERDKVYIQAVAKAAQGMSLRDYFAAKAMQALIEGALASDADFPHRENVADRAYAYADAMLVARNQKQDPTP
ncbi:hypothetical protein ACF8LD_04960 [Pseudomonas sp. zbq_5]|uniref:hypothetical protein n=1 Tax=unclassified Pseudomonas TaxID=196821 RepID=UPI00370BEBBB